MDYIEIQNMDFFKNSYSKIEELKKDFPVNHGFIHISNVVENSKKLARLFNLSLEETEILLISSVLHDVGYLEGRDCHPEKGAILVKEFLKNNFNFNESKIERICKTIANHGGKSAEEYSDVISLCLILADKIDFISKRYNSDFEKYPNVKPFLTIKSTYFEKIDNKLIFHIETTDKNLFLKEVGSYYYEKLPKVFENVKKVYNFDIETCFDEVKE